MRYHKKKSHISTIFLLILTILAIVLFIWVKPAKENKKSQQQAQQQEEQQAEQQSGETEEQGQEQGQEEVSKVDKSSILLVNKTHSLASDYVPTDLVAVENCIEGVGTTETRQLSKDAANAFAKLVEGASQAGYQIAMRTGYRSYEYQKNLFNSYASRNGEEAANKYSAKPGESEHQTGLCLDVSSPSVSWQLSYEYGETEEGTWLYEHCCEYGFILRYLEGKEDITGYVYEPWHIRYVGVDAATEIYQAGLTLEEYLGLE